MALIWVGCCAWHSVKRSRRAWTEVAASTAAGLVEVVMRHGTGAAEYLIGVSAAASLVNLVFMLLNLLPILPLDGGRIVASLLPRRAAGQLRQARAASACRCCSCCCSSPMSAPMRSA